MNKRYVSWQEVEHYINKLVEYVNHYSFTGIYGVPRGGIVIAVILSHRLHIPLLMAPCDGCLIVDDICDSGESLVHYINNTSAECKPTYFVATMFYKKNRLVEPDFWYHTKDDRWVVFPWENKED